MTVKLTACVLSSNCKTKEKAYNFSFFIHFPLRACPSHELRTEHRGLCCFCIKPQKTLTISLQILIMYTIDK